MPACAGMTTLGRFSRFSWNQGDARLRGHDKFGAIFAFFKEMPACAGMTT